MCRLYAYAIDYIIITAFSMIFCIYVIGDYRTHMLLSANTILLLIYLYFFINDFLFKGSSIGKKIVGLKIYPKDQNRLRFAFLHATIKFLLTTVVGMITLILYIYKGFKMPYDKYFYKEII